MFLMPFLPCIQCGEHIGKGSYNSAKLLSILINMNVKMSN